MHPFRGASARGTARGPILGRVLTVLMVLVVPATLHAENLIFNSSYSPPYTTDDHDGILEEILREACRRAGHRASFRNLPAERALLDAESGVSDGVVARIDGMEGMYPSLVMVPSATIPSRDFVAFSREALPRIRAWEDLAPYNIAYVRGWKIIENSIPDAESALALASTQRAFMLLARDRTDVVINARLDGLVMADRLGIEDVQVHEPPLASVSLYPYLHRRHVDIVPDLAAALEAMKADGTFQRIYETAMSAY